MGTGADDRLKEREIAKGIDSEVEWVGPYTLDNIEARAEDLAQTNGIPFDQALKIVSGKTRTPYGTPGPK